MNTLKLSATGRGAHFDRVGIAEAGSAPPAIVAIRSACRELRDLFFRPRVRAVDDLGQENLGAVGQEEIEGLVVAVGMGAAGVGIFGEDDAEHFAIVALDRVAGFELILPVLIVHVGSKSGV